MTPVPPSVDELEAAVREGIWPARDRPIEALTVLAARARGYEEAGEGMSDLEMIRTALVERGRYNTTTGWADYVCGDALRALDRVEAAVREVADWPHVRIYAGGETPYVPSVLHGRCEALFASPAPGVTQ
jgi:hypothetical protein